MKDTNKQKTVEQQHVVKVDINTLKVKQGKTPTAKPTATKTSIDKQPTPTRLDPTRYGDWEKNGRCIDF